MRNGFTFYRSRLEMLEGLDDKTFRNLIEAILEKGLNDKDIELLGIAKNLFIPVKPILEKEYKKYLNGAKGGAPMGNTNAVKNGGFDIKQPKNNQKQANEKGIMNNEKGKNNNDVDLDNTNLNKNELSVDLVNIDGDLTFQEIVNKFYKKSGHKIDMKKSEKTFNSYGFTKEQKDLIVLDMNIFKLEYKYGIKEQMYRPGFDRYIEGLNLDDLQRDYRLKNIAKYHIENATNGVERAKIIKETLSEEQFELFKKQCKIVQTKDVSKLLNLKK